jgi:hypothetical protein
VPVLKEKKLCDNDCLPKPMASSPNTMVQKFLQAQEAIMEVVLVLSFKKIPF